MSNSPSDYEAVIGVVRNYVEGMCAADGEKIRAAFHPKACCIGNFDGGLEWDDREAFIAAVEAAVETPDIDPHWLIRSIAINGDTAMVVVEDDWLGMQFVDSLGLLKRAEGWQIVSKVFHHREP